MFISTVAAMDSLRKSQRMCWGTSEENTFQTGRTNLYNIYRSDNGKFKPLNFKFLLKNFVFSEIFQNMEIPVKITGFNLFHHQNQLLIFCCFPSSFSYFSIGQCHGISTRLGGLFFGGSLTVA